MSKKTLNNKKIKKLKKAQLNLHLKMPMNFNLRIQKN